jgi:DnaJ-domain-containing protein 1
MCEWESCEEIGDCPAPKYRDSSERYWFCQEHAGLYNRNWNYFKGMTQDEAERVAREEMKRAKGYRDAGTWRDSPTGTTKEERERNAALDVLGLDGSASQAEVKAAFRDLAKKHHPDANPGDEAAAERFKSVVAAYELLRE